MKQKWYLPLVLLIILLLNVPFRVEDQVVFPVKSSFGTWQVTTGSVSASGWGRVLVRDVVISSESDSILIESIQIRSTPLKLLKLKSETDVLLSLLETESYNSLHEMIKKKVGGITVEEVRFSHELFSLSSGTIQLKRNFGGFKGAVKNGDITWAGTTFPVGDCTVRTKKNSVSIELDQKIKRGKVVADVTIDTLGITEGTVEVRNLPLSLALNDSLDGNVDLAMDLFRSDSSQTLCGNGKLLVEHFQDRSSSLLTRARTTVSYLGIDTISFKKIVVPVTLKNDTLFCDKIEARGKPLRIEGDGTVEMKSGKYHFSVEGNLPEEHKEHVSSVVWGGLLPDTSSGVRSFSGKVIGKKNWYDISIDQKIIKRSVKSFFRGIFGKEE